MEIRDTLHTLEPPDLPQHLSPAQAAEMSELLEYLHNRIRALLESVKFKGPSERITLNFEQWQNLLDVQARLAGYLRSIGDPHEPEDGVRAAKSESRRAGTRKRIRTTACQSLVQHQHLDRLPRRDIGSRRRGKRSAHSHRPSPRRSADPAQGSGVTSRPPSPDSRSPTVLPGPPADTSVDRRDERNSGRELGCRDPSRHLLFTACQAGQRRLHEQLETDKAAHRIPRQPEDERRLGNAEPQRLSGLHSNR